MLDNIVEYIENSYEGGVSFAKAIHTKDQIAESILSIIKQMIIADEIVATEELEIAAKILKSGPVNKYLNSQQSEEKFVPDELETLKKIPLFHLFFVIRDSLNSQEISDLREHLTDLAYADGEFHPNEKRFINFFDLITRTK